jgi:Putative zinc-finger
MNPMRRVIYVLTLRCDDSARLQSHAMDRELAGYERAALRMHLVTCRGCRRYRRYLGVFREIVRSILAEEIADRSHDGPEATLSAGAKARMRAMIEGAAGG